MRWNGIIYQVLCFSSVLLDVFIPSLFRFTVNGFFVFNPYWNILLMRGQGPVIAALMSIHSVSPVKLRWFLGPSVWGICFRRYISCSFWEICCGRPFRLLWWPPAHFGWCLDSPLCSLAILFACSFFFPKLHFPLPCFLLLCIPNEWVLGLGA